MRNNDLENHMVLNTPDAPWNQPDAPEETAQERVAREEGERKAKNRAAFIDSLADLADFYEKNPDMPLPSWSGQYVFTYDRETFLKAVKVLSRGGKVTKSVEDTEYGDYKATREFGSTKLIITIPRRTICRLVTPAVYDCPDSLLEAAAGFQGNPNA